MIRFGLRVVILAVFSTFSTQGYALTLRGLLLLAALYCLICGAARRELPLGPVFTHYDEAAGYALLGRIISFAA